MLCTCQGVRHGSMLLRSPVPEGVAPSGARDDRRGTHCSSLAVPDNAGGSSSPRVFAPLLRRLCPATQGLKRIQVQKVHAMARHERR